MLIRKVVAREWLYLLALLVFGSTIVPFAFMLFFGHVSWNIYQRFITQGVVKSELVPCCVVVAPYALFQLTRSIVWAVRTLKKAD